MPRSTLTRDQIVRTAVDLLDDEGLDGLNMRALGRRLGVAPTAVYWHVKDKDALMLLAGDEVWDEIDLPDPDREGWRPAATRLATGLHAMCGRHPWLVQALGSYVLHGPRKARYDDRCLAVFEAAGFADDDADRAAAAVFTYVLGNAVGASATASLTRRLARGGADPRRALEDATAEAAAVARTFPRLRRRVDSPAARYNAGPDQAFAYGLDALLDGIEAGLSGAPAAAS
ncbi:TetR/AcrR family transcriptional regulator [Streptomonospora nanhaiensis]|uniref:AcrR family transcriptional regulator n=1 Tax=Streptomonospora nanhaiensis TaxID=1323731 RepID=A0A853BLN1_9ACTN|nr:TetR/AcrR family transcriptional regulator C-terminal domain-containing protein [Streptomonospora nanhaiensis]MBV2365772.1 TetR/AcrR family transcriptional regulator C-terminal domain-containing protein [Streptomonospora nanhaiensis]NYI96469.1 AcrR family transcriptional regulator [Streptomonospora nanhaiensis]